MKLQFAGIEIYAGIDAYARHILWIYVGVLACTQISVYCQYLNTLKATGTFSALLRADRGTKTRLIADAHFKMSQAVRTENEPGFKFKDCFRYGKSTKNQRIEAWWGQLTKTQNFRWRVSYFVYRHKILNSGINIFRNFLSYWCKKIFMTAIT